MIDVRGILLYSQRIIQNKSYKPTSKLNEAMVGRFEVKFN